MNRTPRTRGLARSLVITVSAAALLAGCGPKQNPALDSLRAEVVQAKADPALMRRAPAAVDDASKALDRAEWAQRLGSDQVEKDHTIYLARRRLEIARAQSAEKAAEEEIARIGAQRDADLANARARGADQRAASAEGELRATQRSLDEQSALARAGAASNVALERDLAQLRQELSVKETDRGVLFTFENDVLFDVGRSEIKAGARQRLARLVDFLIAYPDRLVRVEGHTDSTGGSASNMALSRERANAVRMLFIEQGVAPDRLVSQGFGADSPVASNDSSAGRQQNRRVEIVMLNAGQSPAGASR